MRIYPAIDIKDGKCVRLFKGQFSDVTVYGDSPAEMANKWESLGGEYIHVVDLDGALKGHGVNAAKIKEICEEAPLEKIVVETGSPYLSPHPLRGTINVPKNIALVVDEISRLKKVSKKHIIDVLYDNSCKMFHV